jgi:AraC-like DNA-binding protein
LNVTPNHLNKCVKTTTDKTAQDLLNEMLILEAKSLLKYSNLQIAEIAVKLCNQTPSNFARFFKSQTGISPKEYQ